MRIFNDNKKTFYCVIITIILLISGIVSSLLIYNHESNRRIACIYQEGVLIETIDLNAVSESFTMEITGKNGASNTIEIHPGEIGIISASCPDKVCINMGFIKNDMLPITCLPNKLVIQIKDNRLNTDEIDGLSY